LIGITGNYTIKQWDRLFGYLEDGRLQPDNSAVENNTKPFVVGRKSRLFSGTPEEANASAVLYSFIETANQTV